MFGGANVVILLMTGILAVGAKHPNLLSSIDFDHSKSVL